MLTLIWQLFLTAYISFLEKCQTDCLETYINANYNAKKSHY
jgi:hypothetical protein